MALQVRRSITELQAAYDAGDKAPLEALVRAWRGIKALAPDDPNSFFVLGGFHGEPFRGPGETSGAWWGGYCQHGTVLFPTWHRAYLHTLETALQSIPGCADVTLPFWDECSEDSKHKGIPRVLTQLTFELDGATIDNPLRSFALPQAIVDEVTQDNQGNANAPNYSKPKGYKTVRYPLSGLVGTTSDQSQTNQHNAAFPDDEANILTLDANIMAWLTLPVTINGQPLGVIAGQFQSCMDAPTYTLFSNTTSMQNWNDNNPKDLVTALESPHNYMHLAVGGFDIPSFDASSIQGANGDMGENDTAALDPIFYFHHCFIDYAFWTWQRRHGQTRDFTIDAADPGASYIAAVGSNNQPPAGAHADDKLAMTTALLPFERAAGQPFTSADVVDIEGQLGYTYGPGSLDRYAAPAKPMVAAVAAAPTRTVHVADLDRSKIDGSFLVAAYIETDGRHELVGVTPVLSRWNVGGCSNCQTHLKATTDFEVGGAAAEPGRVKVVLHTRNGLIGDAPAAARSAGAVAAAAVAPKVPFTVELR